MSICTPATGVQPAVGRNQRNKSVGLSLAADLPGGISEGNGLERYKSSQVVWLSEPKEAAIVLDPHIKASRFKQRNNRTASFQVRF